MEKIKRWKRRSLIRLISYTLALIVGLTAAATSGFMLAKQNRMILEYGYQRALTELNEYVGNIDITLDKGRYATTSNQLSGLSTKLWRDAGFAKSALSMLPNSGTTLTGTSKFLSQVGNYCLTLSKKVMEGGEITNEETSLMEQLSAYAKDISSQLNEMQSSVQAGSLKLGEVNSTIKSTQVNQDDPSVDSGFQEMEDAFEDYPTLIYDGPFSDHISQQEPKLINEKAEISQEEALEKAKAFSGINELVDGGETAGNLVTYQFTTENFIITVTKKSGEINNLVNSRALSEAKLSTEDALKKGEEIMKAKGYENFVNRYYSMNNGVLTINYAYSAHGVIYYPDLIKVGIAMDNGEMVAFDATGYIMNHTTRKLPAIKITEAKAKAGLSKYLTVLDSAKLALVPTDSLSETLCYEFTCTGSNEEQVLVYINVETGMEEQILILLKDETGVLAL